MECNIKPKDRIERLNACFEMMRSFGQLRPKQIKIRGFRDATRLYMFDKFQFRRSEDRINAIACSSAMGPALVAALIGRMLQAYEIPSGKLLFKKQIPNAT